MRRLFLLAGAAMLAGCDFGTAPANLASPEENDDAAVEASGKAVSSYGNGVVTLESKGTVAESVERVEKAMEKGGITLLAKVDHQQNASGADLEMAPATTLFFGKPEVGTHLMLQSPEAALDLPQRMAIYQDHDGRVIIAYNDPVWLATRHDVTGQEERLKNISSALETLAHAAAGTQRPAKKEKKK